MGELFLPNDDGFCSLELVWSDNVFLRSRFAFTFGVIDEPVDICDCSEKFGQLRESFDVEKRIPVDPGIRSSQ